MDQRTILNTASPPEQDGRSGRDPTHHTTSAHLSVALCEFSHKAKARALLQVVRTAVFPTIIKCDCLSVVNTFNGILNDSDYNLESCADGDMWRAIAIILAGAAPGFSRCQWIPGHLNDPDHPNFAKRDAYLKKGTVTELDIQGNQGADKLADQGVAGHADNS